MDFLRVLFTAILVRRTLSTLISNARTVCTWDARSILEVLTKHQCKVTTRRCIQTLFQHAHSLLNPKADRHCYYQEAKDRFGW